MNGPQFNHELIDRKLTNAMPAGFILRPLEFTDYYKGFLKALSHLTTVGDITKEAFIERYLYFKAHNHEYYVLVIEDTKVARIVGCCTLFSERKFIHGLGSTGHLEDAVTLPEYRGHNFGRILIQGLMSVSKNVGNYKVILDAEEKNRGFYIKCGLKAKETQYVKYHNEGSVLKPKL